MEHKLLHILPFLIGSFISCNSTNNDNHEQENSAVIDFENVRTVQKKKDTISLEHFVKLTDEYEEIPSYLIIKFIDPNWNSSHDPYGGYSGNEFEHIKFNNLVIVSYTQSVAGVCSYTFLKSYDLNGNSISSLKVADHCDHDFSSPQYSYSDYKIYSDSLIEIISSTETAEITSDTIQDYHNSKFQTSEKFVYYIINQSGEFKEIKSDNAFIASSKVLSKSELANISKDSLRLLRNEIFARKGYKFNSIDLQQHFQNKDWYNPQENDVTIKLSPIELFNIEIIRQLEEK